LPLEEKASIAVPHVQWAGFSFIGWTYIHLVWSATFLRPWPKSTKQKREATHCQECETDDDENACIDPAAFCLRSAFCPVTAYYQKDNAGKQHDAADDGCDRDCGSLHTPR
jgi:hypothetical protein